MLIPNSLLIMRARRKSGLTGRTAASQPIGQRQERAGREIHVERLKLRCCRSSEDRSEPILTDAALSMNVDSLAIQ